MTRPLVRCGRRETLAAWLQATGVSAALGWLPTRPSLLVLNYHRIGDSTGTLFDPGMFSATAEGLDEQLAYLERHATIVGLDEALDFVETQSPHPQRQLQVLLTFDDGYRDNYELAFPVLRSHGVRGVFFLPTALIGTTQLPWWDVIAHVVSTAQRPRFTLRYPLASDFDLERCDRRTILYRVLTLFKHPRMGDSDRFIRELELNSEGRRPQTSERVFMDWVEAAEMLRAGMAIESHGHTHQILGRLTPKEQLADMVESARMLNNRLGTTARALAYPVGDRLSFNPDSRTALREAGYRVGFSFYGGINIPGKTRLEDVRRRGLFGQSVARLGVQVAFAKATRAFWP